MIWKIEREERRMFNSKNWYTSKTLWFNSIVTLIGCIGLVLDSGLIAAHPKLTAAFVLIVAIGNKILRFMTHQGLIVKGDRTLKNLIILCLFFTGYVSMGHCYSVRQAMEDVSNDTAALYKTKPEFKVGMGYGLISHTPQAAGSIPLLAWKFLDIGPLLGYDTEGGRKNGKIGALGTLRLKKIPVGNGYTVGDYFDADIPDYFSRLWIGAGPMYDFTGGQGFDVLIFAGWRF